MIVFPLLLWLLFNAYFLAVTYMFQKQASSSNIDKTSVLVLFLVAASMLVWVATTIMIFNIEFPHKSMVRSPDRQCGPAKDQAYLESYIESLVGLNDVIKIIFNTILKQLLTLFLVVLFLLIRINFKK